MRKYLLLTMALGALIALTVAGIASGAAKPNKPSTVRVGNLELTFNGGFSPKALPKKTLAPIALTAEGKIKTIDGTHPPALKEAVVETDKNGAVNVKGYPTCKSGQLQSQDSSHALAICKSALIGEGKTNIEVEFAESKPIPVNSKLLIFNGGEKGGVTTFYIHAYITVPTPAAVVTTVKIKKVHNGRYGLKSVATIPKIAGGSGSVTSFSLKIDKKFTYKGKKVSVLSAKCPDGKLQAHVNATFFNYTTNETTKASTEILRTCTGKG
jgi:hypothetical protein